MAEEIEIKYNVDAGQAIKATDKLADSTEDLADKTSEAEKAEKDAEKTRSKLNKTSKETVSTLEDLGGATGGAIGKIKGMAQSVKLLGSSFSALGVTAIVAAVTALASAFFSTKEGAEQLERIFAGLEATTNVLRDRLVVLGDAVSALFRGDFAEAADLAKQAVSGVTEEIRREAEVAVETTGKLQKYADAERELTVARSEANKELASAKLLIEDLSAPTEDRLRALDEIAAKEAALNQQELNNAQAQLEALEKLAAQSDSNDETLNQLAEQRIKVNELEQASTEKQIELQGKRFSILAEQQAKEDEINAQRLERLSKADDLRIQLIENQEEREIARLERETERELASIEGWENEQELRTLILQKAEQDRQKIIETAAEKERKEAEKTSQEKARLEEQATKKKDDEAKKQQAITDAQSKGAIDATTNSLQVAGALLEEGTAASKAVSVADATIGTYESAIQAYKSTVGIPVVGPIIAPVNAAAAIAFGVANINKILATDNSPSSASSSSSASVSAATAPPAPSVDFNEIQNVPDVNQTVDVGNLENQPPVKAYVVSGEVTSAQEAEQLISEQAQL